MTSPLTEGSADCKCSDQRLELGLDLVLPYAEYEEINPIKKFERDYSEPLQQ